MNWNELELSEHSLAWNVKITKLLLVALLHVKSTANLTNVSENDPIELTSDFDVPKRFWC